MNAWTRLAAIVLAVLVAPSYGQRKQPTAVIPLRLRPIEWRQEQMAFTYTTWQSNNGDALDANSWTNGVPAGDKIAILDGTSQQDMTTGLGGTGCTQVLVKPGYRGNIGSPGDPWNIDLTLGILVYRGLGVAYINPITGSLGNVVVDVPLPFNANRFSLILGGMGTGTQGTVSQLAIKRGTVRVLGDINYGSDVHATGDAVRLVLDAALGAELNPNHMFAIAGEIENSRATVANKVLFIGDRGRLTQIGAINATTLVLQAANGKFAYLPTSAPGTTPNFMLLGGVYDQSDEKFVAVWGTTIIGPDAYIIGGTIRGTNVWPANLDLRDEYPGTQE